VGGLAILVCSSREGGKGEVRWRDADLEFAVIERHVVNAVGEHDADLAVPVLGIVGDVGQGAMAGEAVLGLGGLGDVEGVLLGRVVGGDGRTGGGRGACGGSGAPRFGLLELVLELHAAGA
jgi:hypothetical protein